MSSKDQGNCLLIGAMCSMFGCISLWWGISNAVKGWTSSKWPQTEGVIIATNIWKQETYRHGTRYGPEISYSYKVAGVSYVGNRINVVGPVSFHEKDDAQRTVRGYTPGAEVPVFYAPDNPKRSALNRGRYGDEGGYISFGVLVAGVGLGLIAWVKRQMRLETSNAKGS